MKYRVLLTIMLAAAFATTTAYGYTAQDVSGGGKLSGKITHTGTVPPPLTILMEKNPEVCGTGSREIPDIYVDGSGGLQYAVVYFEKIAAGKKWDGKQIQLNQKGCKFQEWLQVMEAKTELEIINRDPVLHNIHTYEIIGRVRVTIFNEAQPTQGYTFKKKIKMRRSPIMKIECDAHNFMHAWMLVLKNPYYAITAPDGSYSIDQIPAGKYKVTVWHSALGKKQQEIEITAGGTAKLSHVFKS